nr:MAG TPA: hypothetical protein [Caudoviricetes sp.]
MIDKKLLEKFYRMNEKETKNFMKQKLQRVYPKVICQDGFLFAQGTFPVLLVSHLDTVHTQKVKTIIYSDDGDIVTSPEGIGGDDKNGCYAILEVIKKFNCSVLLCEQEEAGCIGAGKFVETVLARQLDFNYIIEFDRANANDAVFYQCANDDFEKFVTKEFYKKQYGSFTDICEIAPVVGCAAVNLSIGYYKAHTTSEYTVLSEMERSIQEACKILERTTENDKFNYVESYCSAAADWIDEMYDDYYGSKYYVVEYVDKNNIMCWYDTIAHSKAEAVGKFVMECPDIPFENVIDVMVDSNVYSYI